MGIETILNCLLWLVISYLLGSINTSIIVSKCMGTDVRKHGSGNAGATNALRTLGKGAAAFVVLGDILKAVLALLLVKWIGPLIDSSAFGIEIASYLAGIGVVLGHNYPIYFGFRGGKGILTSLATVMMIDYKIGLCALVVGILIIAVTRYVSLGSILGVVTYFLLVLIFHHNNIYFIIFSAIVAILAIYRHRENINRLFDGTESKLGEKKKG